MKTILLGIIIAMSSLQLSRAQNTTTKLSLDGVMRSRLFIHESGGGNAYFWGNRIAVADDIMKDGERLEGRGVIPDSMILPTQADLAAGRDPVLAHALQILGVRISPEEAGYIFPYMWED